MGFPLSTMRFRKDVRRTKTQRQTSTRPHIPITIGNINIHIFRAGQMCISHPDHPFSDMQFEIQEHIFETVSSRLLMEAT